MSYKLAPQPEGSRRAPSGCVGEILSTLRIIQMRQSPSPDELGSGGTYVTEAHEVLEGMVKVFRTIHSGPVWQMSCWVREEQRYFRKSLRTKLLEEAK